MNIVETNSLFINQSQNKNNIYFENLPFEILEKIFSYTSFQDIRHARELSHQYKFFIEYSKHPKIQKAFQNFFIDPLGLNIEEVKKRIYIYSNCESFKTALSKFYLYQSTHYLDVNDLNKKNIKKILNIIPQEKINNISNWSDDEKNIVFKSAVKLGHLQIMQYFLKDELFDPSIDKDFAIRMASRRGYFEIVKSLLQHKKVNPNALNDFAFRYAAKNGHLEIVKLLLASNQVDPGAKHNEAIIKALENNHLDTVFYLLKCPRVDPSDKRNYLIYFASKKGYVQLVEHLVEDVRVNPIECNAIIHAAKNGHKKIVDLLITKKNVDPSIEGNASIILAAANGHHRVVKRLIQDVRINANARKNVLKEAIGNGHPKVIKILKKDLKTQKMGFKTRKCIPGEVQASAS